MKKLLIIVFALVAFATQSSYAFVNIAAPYEGDGVSLYASNKVAYGISYPLPSIWSSLVIEIDAVGNTPSTILPLIARAGFSFGKAAASTTSHANYSFSTKNSGVVSLWVYSELPSQHAVATLVYF